MEKVNLNRGQYFTNVEVMGDEIIERYIDIDGIEKIRTIKYQPTLYVPTQAKTEYMDIYDRHCNPKKFESMTEARRWMYNQKRQEQEVLGMDNFVLSYLSDVYKDDIVYDINKIRIAIFDIEVTTDGPFPNETEAEYPIDAISIYDTLDQKIYVFDLIQDDKLGVPKVKPWRPDYKDLDKEIIDKVEYRTFTCSDELLIAFIDYIRFYNPALLVGWNSEKFDIPYIMNRLKMRFGEEYAKNLSPYNEVYEITSYDSFENKFTSYKPKGLAHMDYMEIYRAFRFKTQPSMKLDYIGTEETGKGKIEYSGPIHTLRRGNYLPTVKPTYNEDDTLGKWLYVKYMINEFVDRKLFNTQYTQQLLTMLNVENVEDNPDQFIELINEIDSTKNKITDEELSFVKTIKHKIFEVYSNESHRKYITYSIFDVQLVKDIDDSLSFLELVFDIAYYAKMPIDAVMSKIQIWDAIIFNSLKKDKRVVPMKEIPEHNERIVGAFVKDPIVGIHKMVMSFDLTSLEKWGYIRETYIENFLNCWELLYDARQSAVIIYK